MSEYTYTMIAPEARKAVFNDLRDRSLAALDREIAKLEPEESYRVIGRAYYRSRLHRLRSLRGNFRRYYQMLAWDLDRLAQRSDGRLVLARSGRFADLEIPQLDVMDDGLIVFDGDRYQTRN